MEYAVLFPPGDVLWLVQPGDLALPDDAPGANTVPRLFRVRLFDPQVEHDEADVRDAEQVKGRVEVVFKQMLFTSQMLSSHLPHK